MGALVGTTPKLKAHLAQPNFFSSLQHLNEDLPYILKQPRRSMVHQCISSKNYAVSAEFFCTT
jgi:hypothetical protein